MDASDAKLTIDTKPTIDGDQTVRMRDGFVAARKVLQRLWDIEARGASFVITETGFTITPEGILTPGDRAFLLAHLDEAKRIVNYEADDAHLDQAVAT